ncbi:EVE domain-containing protein [Actinoplanes sp. NPDC049265]|uniref:EVE domain-containing protein n=1 Tax=Actinoplanes sp. NPDC049265 TaxID=3363902 RepID=UPI00371494B4
MGQWLLRCNPAHWRIRDFFTDGHTSTGWTIKQHWKRIRPGDDVAVWLSGEGGGVVAIGSVAGEPHFGPFADEDAHYWTGDRDPAGERWVVPVEFTAHFLDHPIGREVLEADPRFAHALILRMTGGRNPSPLTDEEWAAVADRVPPPGPQVVATAVRGAAAVVVAGASAVREAFRSVVG